MSAFRMPDEWYEPADEVNPDDSFIDDRDDDRAYDAWRDDVISGHAEGVLGAH